MIKHIWFDFSETIARLKKEKHDILRYETYASVVGKVVNEELKLEYEALFNKFNKSNAAVFYSLGKASGFWSEKVNSVTPNELYELSDPSVPAVLEKIKEKVPISIFSNIQVKSILPVLSIGVDWFTNILGADMVHKPKPALDGFYKMITLSALSPHEILYIGDDIGKDIRPAKTVGIQAGIMWSSVEEADYSFNDFKDILKII